MNPGYKSSSIVKKMNQDEKIDYLLTELDKQKTTHAMLETKHQHSVIRSEAYQKGFLNGHQLATEKAGLKNHKDDSLKNKLGYIFMAMFVSLFIYKLGTKGELSFDNTVMILSEFLTWAL